MILVAVVLLGFGWWCVSLVLSVGEQRRAVEQRVSWLSAMQQAQSSLHNPGAFSPQQLRASSAGVMQAIPAELARELEAQLTLVEGEPSRDTAQLEATINRLIVELRKQTGALSTSLGREWDSLNYLVLAALLLAASNLLLLFRAQQKNQKLQHVTKNLERELAGRQETELALRSSQLRNQLIIDGSNDGIWDWDLLSRQISYSPRWLSMLGITAPLQGSPEEWLTRLHPEDEPRVRRELQENISGKAPFFESEHRIRHQSGSYLWVLARGMTLYDQEKRPQRMAGSQTDITKRRSLAQVEESTALLEYATSFLGVGVMMLSAPELVSYVGAPLHELAKPWGDFSALWGRLRVEATFPGEAECPRCRVRVRQGRTEVRLQSPAGDFFVFSLVFAGHGHPLGRDREEVILLQNITELNQLQAQLQQTERWASLGLMAAGLAHELNNPLTYTLLNLDDLAEQLPGLLRDPQSPEVQASSRTLLEVVEGVKRIQRIAREVRLFSHPSNEAPSPVMVSAALEEAVQLASPQISNQISIVNRAASERSYVLANKGLLGQVFVNLLLNAAQSISEKEPRAHQILIEARRVGSSVVVQITDTGVGIAPQQLARIFEPFVTTKSLTAGTGLGLAISHRLVSSMGGEITAKSAPGVGSTFSVSLPICEAPAGAARAAQPTDRLRILVVDDEAFILYFLQKILAEHEILSAKGVDEAMAKISSEPAFDFVLSDLNMPEKSGEDLFELLRETPSFTGEIVFMSGGGYVPKKDSFALYLRDHCLEKPFDLEQLKAALTKKSSVPE